MDSLTDRWQNLGSEQKDKCWKLRVVWKGGDWRLGEMGKWEDEWLSYENIIWPLCQRESYQNKLELASFILSLTCYNMTSGYQRTSYISITFVTTLALPADPNTILEAFLGEFSELPPVFFMLRYNESSSHIV